MNINETAQRCFELARAKGWHERPVGIVEQVALLHSECSEALESFRNKEAISWTDEKGKPQGVASEFADIFIRLGDYAIRNSIDLEWEIERKLQFNATREHRHGNKAA